MKTTIFSTHKFDKPSLIWRSKGEELLKIDFAASRGMTVEEDNILLSKLIVAAPSGNIKDTLEKIKLDATYKENFAALSKGAKIKDTQEVVMYLSGRSQDQSLSKELQEVVHDGAVFLLLKHFNSLLEQRCPNCEEKITEY